MCGVQKRRQGKRCLEAARRGEREKRVLWRGKAKSEATRKEEEEDNWRR